MLTNMLQLAYNVADNIVVGRFSGDLLALGFLVSEPVLRPMGTADEFMSRSLLYAKIICIGFPDSAIKNGT